MSLLIETLCLLNCRGPSCSLDCKPLCTRASCVGCTACCAPHPYNCKYFFSCSSTGEYTVQQCPPRTGFNPLTFTCEPGLPCFLDDCTSLCTGLQCDEGCCAPNDCNSYFQCSGGDRTLKWCTNGNFNPKTLDCEQEYLCETDVNAVTPRVLDKEEFLNAIYAVYKTIEKTLPSYC